jgi:GNAT superfamily N-acetyltransferase
MDDATLRARAYAALDVHTRLLASHAGSLHEDDGWIACVLPDMPSSSILNCVVGEPDVARARAIYADAGIEKWGVWLDSKDVAAARRLEQAGLVLDSAPVVMGAALDAMDLRDAPETQPVELRTLGAINDRVYGYEDGRLERTLAALPPDAVDPHSIHHNGEAVAVTFTFDAGDDATVCWVATLPQARRKGLASGVIRGALRKAKERGRTTTTLWASAMGAPVYERLGYRTLGHLHLWERRP